MSTREYSNVINVFFVLVSLWVEVEGGGVSHVAARFIGNDGYIIAYLVLIRVALERIKRIADRDVRRPCNAAIRTPGIE